MEFIDYIKALMFLAGGWDFRVSASHSWANLIITLMGVPPEKRPVIQQLIKNYLGDRPAQIVFEPEVKAPKAN